jgi:hypothetical protein
MACWFESGTGVADGNWLWREDVCKRKRNESTCCLATSVNLACVPSKYHTSFLLISGTQILLPSSDVESCDLSPSGFILFLNIVTLFRVSLRFRSFGISHENQLPSPKAWRHNNDPTKINALRLFFASSVTRLDAEYIADCSFAAFSKELEVQLPAACSKPQGSLFTDIQRHIFSFPSSSSLGPTAASKFEEIDSNGTSLWNLCTRLRRNFENDENGGSTPTIIITTRVFAFFLLDCALESGKGTNANVIRLMKIGNKAAKGCIGTKRRGCTQGSTH